MAKPTIAVITATRNNSDTILKTLASIHLQTYSSWQHVVKDANSTDGTIEILKRHAVNMTLLTGSDKGIYDALNITIEKVTAEWTIVIQSNDLFFDNDVLKEVSQYLTNDVDIVYGDIINIHATGAKEVKTSKPVSDLWKGMIASHQAMFIRTSLLRKFPYDLSWKIAGDYDFLWKCFKSGATFKQIPVTIATVDGRGLASNKIVENMKEKKEILAKYDKNPLHQGYSQIEITRVAATKFLKKVLPTGLVKKIIEWKSSKKI